MHESKFPAQKQRKGLAIASLVLGIISIPTFGLLVVGAVTGIVLGILALIRVGKQPQIYGGKGLAIAGIATSAFSLLLIPVIGLIGILTLSLPPRPPMTERVLNEARERAAITSLQTIHKAQVQLFTQQGRYGTLKELAAESLIPEAYVSKAVNGYFFFASQNNPNTFCVRAEPEQKTVGLRSFSLSEAGIIRSKDGEMNPSHCNDGTSLSEDETSAR